MENKLSKTWLVMKTVLITFGLLYMVGDTQEARELEAALIQQADRITETKRDLKDVSEVVLRLNNEIITLRNR